MYKVIKRSDHRSRNRTQSGSEILRCHTGRVAMNTTGIRYPAVFAAVLALGLASAAVKAKE